MPDTLRGHITWTVSELLLGKPGDASVKPLSETRNAHESYLKSAAICWLHLVLQQSSFNNGNNLTFECPPRPHLKAGIGFGCIFTCYLLNVPFQISNKNSISTLFCILNR